MNTAANSSRLSDGTGPDMIFDGPVAATNNVLERAAIELDDVDPFEVHEAYAVPVLIWKNPFEVHEIASDA